MQALKDWAERVGRGALSAALSAAVVYIAAEWDKVPLGEPYKTVIALLAVALWNRFRGHQS